MSLKLPAGRFKAYLFDCDGTIIDSMPVHYLAWKQALAEWHCTFDEQLFYAWGGMPTREVISTLNKQQGLRMPTDVVAERKDALYSTMFSQLITVPEVVEFIQNHFGKTPLGVVSGGSRESVSASLRAVNLLDKFDVLICAGDYKRAKPDPEGYLLAAEKLGVAPESCLVFEDTDIGIQAAVAAGMASVKIPPPWDRHED
jgi:beta-phosphoglucomutase-like phosphatase (HAD superfamily)